MKLPKQNLFAERLTLRNMVALIGFIFLLLVWVCTAALIDNDYETTVDGIQRENSNLAKSFEEHIRRTLIGADNQLKLLREEYTRENKVTNAVRAIVDSEPTDPAIIQSAVIDSEGRYIASKIVPPLGFESTAQRGYFQSHLASEDLGLVISKPLLGNATGKWAIYLSRRMNNPDGSFKGLVFSAISIDYFDQFYKKMELFKGDIISLNTLDGNILVRVSHEKILMGLDSSQSAIYQYVKKAAVDSVVVPSVIDGENRFVSYRVLADYALVVVVGVSKDRALAAHYERRFIYVLTAVLASIFISVAGYIINRQRKRELAAQKAQLASYEKYMKIFSVSPDAVTINRLSDGLYREVNLGFTKLLGYTREDAIGKTSRELDIWTDIEERSAWTTVLMETGEVSSYEVALRRKDGDVRTCQTSAKLLELDSEQCILTMTRDVTEHKQAEREILSLNDSLKKNLQEMQSMNVALEEEITERQSMQAALGENEARYRAIVEQAAEAILLVNAETGEIFEANVRFSEQFGYDLRRDGPLSVYDITIDEPASIDHQIDDLRSMGTIPPQRRTVRHKNGFYVSADRSAAMVHYRERDIIVVTLRDVSDEVHREQALRRDAQMATRVQNALLSAMKSSDYLDVATVYQPREYVGGDLYFMDMRYDNNLLRGFLLDAIGHGLGTALHTASLHVLIREVNELDLPLSDTMRWLNRRTVEYFDEGTIAGALAFEFDLETRQMRWVCAGISKIWLSAKSQQGVLAKPGMWLGINANEVYETNSISLNEGDAFYFMTDGLNDLVEQQVVLPLNQYPAMVNLMRTLSTSADRRDDATAIGIRVRSLPQSVVRQDGWPRVLRFNGYGDYQRLKGEVGKVLAEVTGQSHSLHEVAVHEALANAMECRDGAPRQHNARLRFNMIGSRFIVRVKTSRIGFAGNAILRRLRSHPEDLFSFGEDAAMGRGIPMMLSISHKMTYNSEGTEVLLAWTVDNRRERLQ